MFWGLIMEPKKQYSKTVEIPFHVSMATLDVTTGNNEIVQLMITYNNTNYLLCNLKKDSLCQVPLDLNFEKGNEITFKCSGECHVHLTGYLNHEFPLNDLEKEEEEEEEEEKEEFETSRVSNKQSKRKATYSPKVAIKAKRMKREIESSDAELQSENSNDISANLNESDEEDEEEGEEEEEEEAEEEEEEEEEEEGEDEEIEVDDSYYEDVDDNEFRLNVESIDDSKNEEETDDDAEEKENKPIKQSKKDKEIQRRNKKQDEKKLIYEEKDEQRKQCKKQQKKRLKEQNVQIKEIKKIKTLLVKDIKLGTGAVAKSGKLVSIYYVGKLNNGKKFDENKQGNGFKFKLGRGQVMKGWDLGIIGMKVGGKRQITIPPSMAYGAKGCPPLIPGNSTLDFEIELRNVH